MPVDEAFEYAPGCTAAPQVCQQGQLPAGQSEAEELVQCLGEGRKAGGRGGYSCSCRYVVVGGDGEGWPVCCSLVQTTSEKVHEVDYFDGKYIIVVEGKVIALDVETGKELYVNEDFRGSGIAWSTNYEGDKLYMCGYFGPDVFVMDVNTGKTLNRITAKDPDIYWAYQIDYINEHQVDVTYENIEKAVSYDPEGPEEQ